MRVRKTILVSRDEDKWRAVVSFCSEAIEQKKAAGRKKERAPLPLGRPRKRAQAGCRATAVRARPRDQDPR